ncbi:MAG: hypothetical protein ACJAV5_002288 [Vicingaceae bacterium]|jgi:hypothetical protein
MLSSDELNDLIHSTSNDRNKRLANSLEMALNDWPKPNLSEPDELITELKKVIAGKLTFEALSNYLNGLAPMVDAWKMESLSYIVDMFDTKEARLHDDLESIINRFTENLG